jgi:hypothetical protein
MNAIPENLTYIGSDPSWIAPVSIALSWLFGWLGALLFIALVLL